MKTYSYTLEEILERLPRRTDNAHKGSCGKLLLIAGSKNMAGAAYLAAKAAYRSGVGLVYIYTTEENRTILQTLIPEAVLHTYEGSCPSCEEVKQLMKGKDAVAVGPGIGISDEMQAVVRTVLDGKLPVILDADGLNNLSHMLAFLEKVQTPLVITPHPMEMARLCKQTVTEVLNDKAYTALSFSEKYHLITVLKDHHTLVTDGVGLYRNETGNHGMATGGSGDVLTGVIGSLLAQGMDPFEAAKTGVYLHGKAGDDAAAVYGKRSLMAGDIADYVFRGL